MSILSPIQLAAVKAIAALYECEEYFDDRADADCDLDGFIPNKEMRILAEVRDAIHSIEAAAKQVQHEQL